MWVRAELAPPADGWHRWLAAAEQRLAAAVEGRAGEGRAAAERVGLAARSGVWRRNRHGGFTGRFLGAHYLGHERLRAEIELSEALRALDVDTPAVLLGAAVRRGPTWRQHLVTEEIAAAKTVFVARKDTAALSAADALLERLFDLGLWAPDLHPGNLLWQPAVGRCWLIDLAGARLLSEPLTAKERRRRRARFGRYFRKHAGSVPAPFA